MQRAAAAPPTTVSSSPPPPWRRCAASSPAVADDVVAAIVDEVPSYRDAFSGPMGETIRNAVQLALGGFLTLASRAAPRTCAPRPPRPSRAATSSVAARRAAAAPPTRCSRRSGSALGCRGGSCRRSRSATACPPTCSPTSPSWSSPTSTSCPRPRSPGTPTRPRPPAGSGSGCSSAIAVLLLGRRPRRRGHRGRRERGLDAAHHADRRARPRVAGAPGPRPGRGRHHPGHRRRRAWTRPRCSSCPDAHARRRTALLRTLRDRGSIAGPAVPWLEVRRSVDRALRARELGIELDTEAELPRLVLHADESALADLRARVLAPLEGLRPGTAEKLADTLRAWLLHQGRRDDVAAALFVHPQTVRYRMGQLRDLYGDKLDDPDTVLALTLALA